ncbi:hypothetical protein N802_11040 [Knoellia sinensis KCTC 19936]|uniref:Uncharacterized protein n=1 Tax=Knoellia sinensis KCTC 19936 TaxID=1385520 RepID=A0A0A0J997_9MICO|nr:hypothetical protein N802_11040 [Knoellia sinensis KCTC 19936]
MECVDRAALVGRGLGRALVDDLVGCPRPLGRLAIRRASWLGRGVWQTACSTAVADRA